MRAVRNLFVCVALPVLIALPVAARAQSLPVVNVNNEIGLAADVMLQDDNYDHLPGSGPSAQFSGWQPGLEAKASAMQDVLGISNLYAAVRFNFNDGGSSIGPTPPYAGVYNRVTNNLGVEFGKGFLISNDFLLTPFIQGGYTNLQSSLGDFTGTTTNGYVGLGLRGDYALTNRLVLTGRLGWAETLGGSINDSFQLGPDFQRSYTLNYGDMPMWQAGIGLDYVLFSHVHLYGGVDYTEYGLARGPIEPVGLHAVQANFNDLNFHLGIAWSF